MLDVAMERLIEDMGVERREQVLAKVPHFGNIAMNRDINPADDAAGWHVHAVRDVAQHLGVVRHHLPLNRIAGERFRRLDCIDKHSARRA